MFAAVIGRLKEEKNYWFLERVSTYLNNSSPFLSPFFFSTLMVRFSGLSHALTVVNSARSY